LSRGLHQWLISSNLVNKRMLPGSFYASDLKMKQCPKCKEKLPLNSFGKHKGKRDGLQSWCKRCRAKYNQSGRAKITQEKQRKSRKHKDYQKEYFSTIKGILIRKYHDMKQRCDNPKRKDYKYYGGRGIKCLFKKPKEFINYVINSLQIDPRGLTIDRIDNDGHYEPGNIRFVNQAENNKNRRLK